MHPLERKAMQRHEEWISRPVSELFPKDKEQAKTITCKGCGIKFEWTPTGGPLKLFHSSTCKDDYQRRKPTPSSSRSCEEEAEKHPGKTAASQRQP